MQAVLIGIVFVAFLGLIASALRGAWDREQQWKADEAAWYAQHPESHQSTTPHRWTDLLGSVVGLAIVVGLATYTRTSIVEACLIVAGTVLLVRYQRQRKRERENAPGPPSK